MVLFTTIVLLASETYSCLRFFQKHYRPEKLPGYLPKLEFKYFEIWMSLCQGYCSSCSRNEWLLGTYPNISKSEFSRIFREVRIHIFWIEGYIPNKKGPNKFLFSDKNYIFIFLNFQLTIKLFRGSYSKYFYYVINTSIPYPPRYNWNVAESGIKHHQTNKNFYHMCDFRKEDFWNFSQSDSLNKKS